MKVRRYGVSEVEWSASSRSWSGVLGIADGTPGGWSAHSELDEVSTAGTKSRSGDQRGAQGVRLGCLNAQTMVLLISRLLNGAIVGEPMVSQNREQGPSNEVDEERPDDSTGSGVEG
jgi:hypothetical protein